MSAAGPGILVQVSLLSPIAHTHRNEGAVLDQLLQGGSRASAGAIR